MRYYDIKAPYAQGLIEVDRPRDYPVQRLPQKYQESVRKEVWELSENSAGVSISFISDTSDLFVKWSLKHDFKMHHMTDVGIKGVDLYQKKDNTWSYLATGIPTGMDNEQYLLRGLPRVSRQYRLHLPLYDTITNIQIGIDDDSRFDSIRDKNRPMVFYGTSITQGGCVSRPGMAYTNIISRELDHECINLGFDGNGHLETSVAEILSTIDAKIYVVECLGNIDRDTVNKNTIPLIKTIRNNSNDQNAHIVFFEQCITDMEYPDQDLIDSVLEKNNELNEQVAKARKEGHGNLHMIKQIGCFDEDTEATVDGIHFNDLGSQRYARHFIKSINDLNII